MTQTRIQIAPAKDRSVADGWGTHIPVLLACLRNTSGPILELGAGFYSTPIVHAFAVGGRYARTVEVDARWAERVRSIFEGLPPLSFHHDILAVADPSEATLAEHKWSVALVDHETHHRARDLEVLKRLGAELIVAHDTQDPAYHMEPVLETFAHRFDFNGWGWPQTTVVGDAKELGWLARQLEHA